MTGNGGVAVTATVPVVWCNSATSIAIPNTVSAFSSAVQLDAGLQRIEEEVPSLLWVVVSQHTCDGEPSPSPISNRS